jgi:hypothetical protein
MMQPMTRTSGMYVRQVHATLTVTLIAKILIYKKLLQVYIINNYLYYNKEALFITSIL